jgi:two-component system OmpR family response regulator/two-component system response regulator CpxR
MSATILHIDDDPQWLELARLILSHSGYKVESAHSGKLGIDMAASLKPNLILLDVMMPDMTGREVFQQLRLIAELNDTPIVMFSAIDQLKGDYFPENVTHRLAKPIRPRALVREVSRILPAI